MTSFRVSRGFLSAMRPPPCAMLLPLLIPIPQPRTLSLLLSPTPSSEWWSQDLNPDLLIKSSTLSMISELMGSSSLPHTDQPTLRKLQEKTTKYLGQLRCGRLQSMGFSRQEYWSGLLFPAPGDLLDPGIKPTSPSLAVGSFTTEPPVKNPAQYLTLNKLNKYSKKQ